MRIPCDTIARLSHLLPRYTGEQTDPIFDTFRLDNGRVIVTDRTFMAVENVGGWEGVHHINLSDADIEQCRTESQWSAHLDVVPTPALQFTTAKTTLGYSPSGNIGVYPAGVTDFDKWHDVTAALCVEPAAVARGAMVWRVNELTVLARTAPSGVVVFEQIVDVETRPALVRDVNSADWCGFFWGRLNDGIHHPAASLPGWLR